MIHGSQLHALGGEEQCHLFLSQLNVRILLPEAVRHINLWFAFAENLGLGINRMQDIILVTGRHCARSWVNIAFSEGRGIQKFPSQFGRPELSALISKDDSYVETWC